MERKVTLFGNPLTLIGKEVKVGDRAPDFIALDKELREIKLSDFRGKIKVISVTPSLDTPVCDLQAKTFNERASKLSEDVVIINISMDLPFAIARFCSTAGIDKIVVLSDHREASFGLNYGLLIKELRLLCRAVLIIDKEDIIRYLEIVPEITQHPDYERVFQELSKIL
ncbi:MAG: thiol peroxidase [Caldimicrobium sp.]|nr:thiol peroxidase [Caldimicrobium sp.]MCX7873021.1 thiol peroxidase [Caldimicrobium sp.]MDW8094836.1 thiol peroxidase [Caldimicrobium sp.]